MSDLVGNREGSFRTAWLTWDSIFRSNAILSAVRLPNCSLKKKHSQKVHVINFAFDPKPGALKMRGIVMLNVAKTFAMKVFTFSRLYCNHEATLDPLRLRPIIQCVILVFRMRRMRCTGYTECSIWSNTIACC